MNLSQAEIDGIVERRLASERSEIVAEISRRMHHPFVTELERIVLDGLRAWVASRVTLSSRESEETTPPA